MAGKGDGEEGVAGLLLEEEEDETTVGGQNPAPAKTWGCGGGGDRCGGREDEGDRGGGGDGGGTTSEAAEDDKEQVPSGEGRHRVMVALPSDMESTFACSRGQRSIGNQGRPLQCPQMLPPFDPHAGLYSP